MSEIIHITEGQWQVCSWGHQEGTTHAWTEYVVIEHRCKESDESHVWRIHVYHPSVRGRDCPYCHKIAPDGIQGMHWILHEALHQNPSMIRKYS
jgi:hypothetical protein